MCECHAGYEVDADGGCKDKNECTDDEVSAGIEFFMVHTRYAHLIFRTSVKTEYALIPPDLTIVSATMAFILTVMSASMLTSVKLGTLAVAGPSASIQRALSIVNVEEPTG